MKTIIKICVMVTGLIILAAPIQAARIVPDPQQDYLNTKVSELTRNAYIYTLSVDLNEDGMMDYFFSSSAERDRASRRGARTWRTYLSSPQGYQTPTAMEVVNKIQSMLTLNTSTASLQRLANGKLALTYFSIGDIDSGVTVAYYVDDANRLQSMVISRTEHGQISEPVIDMTPVNPETQTLRTQFFPLNELASPEQLQRTRDKTQDYLYNKDLRPDYDNSRLAYIYTKGFDEFLGIQEDMWNAMIPIEAIEEPIRSLLTKRAMARAKGIRMTTDQDKAELAQIMVWFDGWHMKHGHSNKMVENIKKMSQEERLQVLSSIGISKPEDLSGSKAKTAVTTPGMAPPENGSITAAPADTVTSPMTTKVSEKPRTISSKDNIALIAGIVAVVIVGLVMFFIGRRKMRS